MSNRLIDLDLIILDNLERWGPGKMEDVITRCEAEGPISYRTAVRHRLEFLKLQGYMEERSGRIFRTDKPLTEKEEKRTQLLV